MIIHHHTPIKSSLSPAPWKSEMPCINPIQTHENSMIFLVKSHFFHGLPMNPLAPPGPIWSLLDPRAAPFWCPGFSAVVRSRPYEWIPDGENCSKKMWKNPWFPTFPLGKGSTSMTPTSMGKTGKPTKIGWLFLELWVYKRLICFV
jgi:hypothetical protein